MKNTRIATRITLGFAVLLLTMIMSGLFSFTAMTRIEAKVNEVATHDLAFFRDMANLRTHMGNLRRFEKDYFINIADKTKRTAYLLKWKKAQVQASGVLQKSLGKASDANIDPQVSLLANLLNRYSDGFLLVAQKIESDGIGSTEEANKMMGQYKENIHEMEGVLEKVSTQAAKTAALLPDQINSTTHSSQYLLLTLNLIALVIGTLLGLGITQSIRRPLLAIRNTSQELARQRDLNVPIPELGKNEIGDVAHALKDLVSTIHTLIHQAHEHSAQLVSSAEQLDTVSQHVARATEQQSSAASSSATAIEQITESMQCVASNAQDVEQRAQDTAQVAEKGSRLAEAARHDISLISESIAETSGSIEGLNRRSEEIGSIVRVIREIADQTNLLALNAAIEAARAGEMGRGFAVVADEVRKLAERTSQATTEISTHIHNVQNDTQVAYQTMQQATTRIAAGVDSTQGMAQMLGEILTLAQRTVETVNAISHAIKEQSQASQAMAKNVEQIAQMNDSTYKQVQESSRLATMLKALSRDMNVTLGRFRT